MAIVQVCDGCGVQTQTQQLGLVIKRDYGPCCYEAANEAMHALDHLQERLADDWVLGRLLIRTTWEKRHSGLLPDTQDPE